MKFSKFYFPPQELVSYCTRIRRRLGNYIFHLSFKIGNDILGIKVIQNVGITIPTYRTTFNTTIYNFEELFLSGEIKDILDILTVAYKIIKFSGRKDEFLKFTNECFNEEGLAYFMN